jgi:DNA-binding protein YbaB
MQQMQQMQNKSEALQEAVLQQLVAPAVAACNRC